MFVAAPRSRHLAWVFRALVMLVIVALTSQGTLAWLSPCSAHGTSGAKTEDQCCPHQREAQRANGDAALATATYGAVRQTQNDDGRECSCPIDCGSCCSGLPSSNVVTVPSAAPTALLTFSLLTFVSTTSVGGDGEPFDILHVPRA